MRTAEKWLYKMLDGGKIKKRIYRMLLRLVFSCDIPSTIKCGKNIQLPHNGLGVVIHKDCVIGNNCVIYQNVTLGGNGKIINGKPIKGGPTLEDEVAIFGGACVLGPITIGNNSYVGANAVVTKDVPSNCLAYGNPATITVRKFDYNFK